MITVKVDGYPQEESLGHSSKGNQPKWRIGGKWIKADHMGYEGLAEVVVSRLLESSGASDFVRYEPVRVMHGGREKGGCASADFKRPGEELIPLERLHRSYQGTGLAEALTGLDGVKEKIEYAVEFIEDVTRLRGVGAYLTGMLELDALFLNEDRHTNNIMFIRNERTGVFRICPYFDNGLSLLSDLSDYPLDGEVYGQIAQVKSKPFDQDFDAQLEAAEVLYGRQLTFRFTAGDVDAALRGLEGTYSDAVLLRVKQLILEQRRKYKYLFN